MCREEYQWLAAVISAHPDQRIVGRVRLQKVVKLLQSCGLPTRYEYHIHFNGPYSEAVMEDIALLKRFGTLLETVDGNRSTYAIIPGAFQPRHEMDFLKTQIDLISQEERTFTLELAATYAMFKEMGYDTADALARTRRKKQRAWTVETENGAFALLESLELAEHAERVAASESQADFERECQLTV